MMEISPILEIISQSIQEGDDELAGQSAKTALKDGIGLTLILDTVSKAGDQLGETFERGEIFLPSQLTKLIVLFS